MVALRRLSISEVVVMCCEKCGKMMGVLLLVIGLIYLIWDFWGVQWYTIVFLLAGLAMMCMGCCKCCKGECCDMPKETKKKK